MNGGEIFTLLRRERSFDESRTQFYAAEILLGLECLHKEGIIYRDLKPENVVLDGEGHVKLTDFGLSKMFKSGENMAFSFCGTPEYLAPEIVRGAGYNFSVDWWSFGIIIYEMLSGINPFKLRNKTNADKLKMITDQDIPMLPNFSRNANSLLKSLLDRNPIERLGGGETGIQEIKEHKFFEGVDWDAMLNKSIKVPFIPNIKDEGDIG